MLEGAGQHRANRIIIGKLFLFGRVNTAAIDPHPQGTIVISRHPGNEFHLFLPGLLGLMVVEMAGVVP